MVQWWHIVVTVVCIILSGTFSGLTLGLMSLDMIDLRVLSQSGTDREKKYALRILPVRRHGNWLLCTLLIGNTSVNAALAIVTAELFGGIAGFLSSTFIILFVGEIIPQAVCYRFGLVVGAYAVPFIRILMYLTAPLSFTTALALDFVLGGESATRYNRNQLKSLVSIHGVERSEVELQAVSRSASAATAFNPEHDLNASALANDTVIEFNDIPDVCAQSDSILETRLSNNPPLATPQRPVISSSVRSNHVDPSAQRSWFNLISRLQAFARYRKSQRSSPSRRKDKDNASSVSHQPLTKDEMTMLDGAFDFSQKAVGQVMTSLDDVFMLDASLSLNFKILLLIFQSGHSRIPIYADSRENIIGLLFAKDLILLDPEDSVPIKTVLSFFSRTILLVTDETRLNKMLNIFCQGGGHMAIVRKEQGSKAMSETIGVVTLEDLIEELIGQDIVDETDVYMNNLSKQRVKRLRSIDPEVLRMFDSTHDEEILSEKEVLVVASYLSNNTHEFSERFIKLDVLREMLAEIPIIECHGGAQSVILQTRADEASNLLPTDTKQEVTDEMSDRVRTEAESQVERDVTEGEIGDDTTIYSRGVPSKNAYLIIHGRLQITAGDDGFKSEAGPWTLLGVRALTDNLYAPDFTAKVVERPTRLLRISRKLYRLMLHASGLKASGLNSRENGVETTRMWSEARMSEHLLYSNRGPRNSSASRSSPSLAVAAAAAAVAVGSPGRINEAHTDSHSFDRSVVKCYRSNYDRAHQSAIDVSRRARNHEVNPTENVDDGSEELEEDSESELDTAKQKCDSALEGTEQLSVNPGSAVIDPSSTQPP